MPSEERDRPHPAPVAEARHSAPRASFLSAWHTCRRDNFKIKLSPDRHEWLAHFSKNSYKPCEICGATVLDRNFHGRSNFRDHPGVPDNAMQYPFPCSEGGSRSKQLQGQELPQPSSAGHSFPGPAYMPVHQLPPTKRIGGPSLDDGRWWADTKGSSLYDNFIAEAPALSIAGHLGDQLADDGGYYTDYAGPRFHHIAGQQQSVKVAKKQAVTVLLDAIQTGKKMGPKAEDGSFMHRVGNLTPIATNETN